ncbi:hypothetical protein P3X46_000930 [Hevea brasiliensis]|uniref:Uncharacterized protein n=1 Tax=Hevea brasiliensis TaxID=3981 RepID=A0ABQ9NCY0_HEVBR|nr:zinc finger CCCH domain-containing protein 19 [Hevea brasiliensis]KAJ9189665.1 hypothetical protein P3X46_000930 [Hevea brasiliensis]
METEEEDNSRHSTITSMTATATEPQTVNNLLCTQHQCTPHPVTELPDQQFGGGGGDGESRPPPETETKVPDDGECQDVVAGENTSAVEFSELDAVGGGGESQSPPSRSLQRPVAEGGEGESAKAEEESAEVKEEGQRVETPEIVPEIPGKEEEDNVLIPGEERRGHLNDSDSSNEDKDNGVDVPGVNKETETKMEVVVNLVEDSGKAVELDFTGTMKGLAIVYKDMEKRDVVEEKKEEAADTAEEAEMAHISEETKEDADKDNYGVVDAGVDVPGVNMETETTMEVVVNLAEDSWKAVEADITGTMEGPVKLDKDMGKRDVVEETKEEAADTAEEAEMAHMSEEIKEAAFVTAEEAEMAYMAEDTVEVEEEKGFAADVEEEKEGMTEEVALAEEMKAAEQTEMTDNAEETKVAEETEEVVNEDGDMNEMEMADMTEENEQEEEMDVTNAKEESGTAEEADNAEEMELADGTEAEGAGDEEEEVNRNAGGKRKRGKNARAPTRVSTRKKVEEDVCFICFDGGDLVLCDRRGCPKAYHPSCVNRDEAFFQTRGRWNCGWHLCSICEKNAYYMCYTCTFSLCKGCVKDAVILCVRGNKGFCQACMRTVMLIERNEQGNNEVAQINFDDRSSWEYLFKDYWIDLNGRLSITSDELSQAKNPWKGSELHAGKRESMDEPYDSHNDAGSGSDSSGNPEVTTSKRRKAKKRLKSHAKEKDSLITTTVNDAEEASPDGSVQWASKELLEFVMHMKNGDKSVCSQFDVQALLLEYIKRNKLRDPRRKSQIICDSRLEKLFGKPRVGHFEMLKLLETHFLLKEDSQADDLQGSVVDTETNQLEADGNSDVLMKTSKDKRRRSRKKGYGRGLQSNLDDYAAIDTHNINLIYLRRSLLENLIEDAETFHDKVVGSFVRIRISGSAQKQDLYRLVQVVGTNKASEPYRVGKKTTDYLLEILNLNKTEIVSIDIISNQEFTEDECKRLRQSIKCGLINRLTVGDIQEKAMALQAVRVEDSLESEVTRLSHLRDRASDLGRRKELRECVEKLQLLKSPMERQRRLEEIPEIHADPNMDPSYESEEDEGQTDGKRQDYLRPGSSSFNRRGREPIPPGRGSFASNDSWGTRNYSSTNRELSRNLSNKGFLNKGDDNAGAGEILNESLWSQGRDRETQQSQSWENPKSAANLETKSFHPVLSSESVPSVKQDIAVAPSSAVVTQAAIKINETDKIWHYQDPSGKIQGPFSMVQLRKWSNTGYFPADLRIWRTDEKQDDSFLLTDALSGNFQRDPQLVDSSSLKSHSPHLSSSYSTSTGDCKPQSEISNSTGRAASAPLDVPKYSAEKWGSETNLPSPTPAQAATSGTKGKPFESKWSPTPAQPAGSLLVANSLPGGNGELQRLAMVIPEISQLPHSSTPSSSTKLLNSANSPQMHSQSTLSGESPRVQVISHPLPAPDSGGASVNTVIDMKSLQNLVHPVTNNNPLIGTQGWGAVSVSKPEMVASHAISGSGSQGWGSAPSQKPEQNNSISMPTQAGAYGNWGDASTSAAHSSASSFIASNPTGVSPAPGASGLAPSDVWRGPMPGQPNIQPSAAPSNVPWGMGITDNQTVTPKQGLENQNIGWGPVPGNPNMGWGGPVSANSNQGWVVSGQGPAPANANPGWVVHGQVQAPGNANLGWAAPVQGQAQGNAFPGWVPPGQVQTPVNANPAWVAPGQGPPPGNANPSWAASPGNMGSWGSEKNNGDRYSSQRDGGSQGGDTGYGGGKPWNKQSSFGRGDSSRPPFKGHRVCKYHESGHCKKGAACDYLHT